jgi:hypothetical protein
MIKTMDKAKGAHLLVNGIIERNVHLINKKLIAATIVAIAIFALVACTPLQRSIVQQYVVIATPVAEVELPAVQFVLQVRD